MRYVVNGVHGQVDDLPGCTQVAVSHSVFVRPDNRGKGWGSIANIARLSMFRDMGYDYTLCTVDAANTAQVAIMLKNGWKKLDEFMSSKTGHLVQLYGKVLP